MTPVTTDPAATPVLNRDSAYTTPRPDIFELVPAVARDVLDVGCSNGALGRSLKAAAPGRRVSGIEYDADFVRQAAASLDQVTQADLNRFDWDAAFGEQRFDCIIFADVLEHLVDPAACLRQALRHLQPQGCVVLSLPNVRHLSVLMSVFVGGRFPQRDRGIFDRTHLRWFTIADAHALLADAGLRVDTGSQAQRWGDRGGGRMNRLLNRLPAAVQKFGPVREFLTYQVSLRARRPE